MARENSCDRRRGGHELGVVVPPALLQLYFYAQERGGVWAPRLVAYGLFTLALLTDAVIASVSMIRWRPAMR